MPEGVGRSTVALVSHITVLTISFNLEQCHKVGCVSESLGMFSKKHLSLDSLSHFLIQILYVCVEVGKAARRWEVRRVAGQIAFKNCSLDQFICILLTSTGQNYSLGHFWF